MFLVVFGNATQDYRRYCLSSNPGSNLSNRVTDVGVDDTDG